MKQTSSVKNSRLIAFIESKKRAGVLTRSAMLGIVAAVAGVAAREAKAQYQQPGLFANPDATFSVATTANANSGAIFTYVMITADLDTSRSTDGTLDQFRDITQYPKEIEILSSTRIGVRPTADNPPPPSVQPTGYTWAYDGRARTVTEDSLFYDSWTVSDQRGRSNSDTEPPAKKVGVYVKKI